MVVLLSVISVNHGITFGSTSGSDSISCTLMDSQATGTSGIPQYWDASADWFTVATSTHTSGDVITVNWNSGPAIVSCYDLTLPSGQSNLANGGSKHTTGSTTSTTDLTGWTSGCSPT